METELVLKSFDQDHPEDVDALKREIDFLRRQLHETPKKAKPLSWDTELLLRKSQNLADNNIVSCSAPDWQQTIESMHVGRSGIRVDDVRTVEHIEFVAGFAARRDLTMTYGNRSFHLEPRQTPFDIE